jgi:CubicO group peptidase (beta-lactamase class C family)
MCFFAILWKQEKTRYLPCLFSRGKLNLSLNEVYRQFIFEPLGLKNTYLTESENEFVPNICYKNKAIHRPKFVMSSRASGGCVTTARELMIFIKAFFGGDLFDKSIFDKLPLYNKLQAPSCNGADLLWRRIYAYPFKRFGHTFYGKR